MARYRAAVRWKSPTEDRFGLHVETLFATVGEASSSEALDEFAAVIDRTRGAWDRAYTETSIDDRSGLTMECGIVFGRRGRPQEQRVVAAYEAADLDDLLARAREAAISPSNRTTKDAQ